MYLVNSDLLV